MAPTPSRGTPAPHWKISGLKSLGLGSFFVPDTCFFSRVFLNLWFAKPMVCLWVAFHENNGNHETTKTMKTTRTATNKELGAGFAKVTYTTKYGENHGKLGCKPRLPQTTGLEIPDFRVNQLNLGVGQAKQDFFSEAKTRRGKNPGLSWFDRLRTDKKL